MEIRIPGAGKVLEARADFLLPTILRHSNFEVLYLLLGVFRDNKEEEVSQKAAGLILSNFCSDESFYIRVGRFWMFPITYSQRYR